MNYQPLEIGDLAARVPIVQGGMGIGVSLSNLAGAVAKEGGIGVISTAQIGFRDSEFEKDPLAANLRAIPEYLKRAREIAQGGIIGVNIMVATKWYEEYVKAAVAAGSDIIISGAGLPIDLPKYVENTNTKIAPIVSTVKSAGVILKLWDRKYKRIPDMVVIEGPNAGGHLGFRTEELAHIKEMDYESEVCSIMETVDVYERKYARKIPVILAGGIWNSEDMKRCMDMGLDGVQVASRFVTTAECDASDAYKQAYIDCSKEDIVIVKSPVGMPGRAIRNRFIENSGHEGYRPKKCFSCINGCNPANSPYCITEALLNAVKGNVQDGLLFCGASAYKAAKIESVSEVIKGLLCEKF